MSRNIKAFTLIELLVVISIIALLLAILIPALGKVKEKAGLVVCSSNMHQVIIAVNTYAADHGNKLPPHTTQYARANLLVRNKSQGDTYQYKYLGPYLQDVDVYNCPLSRFDKNLKVELNGQQYTYQQLYEEGFNIASMDLSCSYLLFWNYVGYDKDSQRTTNSNNPYGRPFVGPGSRGSENTLLISDSFYYSNALGGTEAGNKWHCNHRMKGSAKSTNPWLPYYMIDGTEADFPDLPAFGKLQLNAGYLDGSTTRFRGSDAIRQQAISGWAASYLPNVWR